MVKFLPLNNVDHKDLKVAPGHCAEFGDDVNQTLIYPTEFANVQREYPILFRRTERGEYESLALLGFDPGENLYLRDRRWAARYVPAGHTRRPFALGPNNNRHLTDADPGPAIYVDLDDPRIASAGADGGRVFLPQGGHAPALVRALDALRIIHDGVMMAKEMFAAFEAADLIGPVAIEAALNDRERFRLDAFMTIDERKFRALSGERLENLHRSGFLSAAILIASSLGNISWLIDEKIRRRLRTGY